ncbi:helix-turn-helix transcriptional regulator [Epilithonimonas hungarica]|uniref:WYL domain-containing protein n=1 Tax=Epilithonimonas hungarica TaxID=454006 RepID=A0A1G7PGK1_9FLAO|nr:WYL domain-containing protein [Epilithonimonas hungarica]MDP9957458.1 putative DNA-binding transcriptional regulator YafY [Epilithonimonas hungarica]SDF85482.1 WYL domain-containing protein [Epilithonimonas hungarica]
MKKDFYLTRYSLIIKRLERSPATYPELESYLLNSFEFQDAKIVSYSIRTLQRDIKDIANLFNFDIHNKKKGDNRYYIESRPVMEVDEYNQRLIESFQIMNAVNSQPDFAEFVYLENRTPRGIQNFYDLLFAIRNKRIIEFQHFKYKDQSTSSRKVHPMALKESKDRWYLIALDTKDEKLKAFGLDRISDLVVSKAGFKLQQRFDLKEHFKNAFGIMNLEEQPENIIIRSTKEQAEYLKSSPLHHSQKIQRETEKSVYFIYDLYPTYDFIQEILSFGNQVKVMEPKSLINKVKETLEKSIQQYDESSVEEEKS